MDPRVHESPVAGPDRFSTTTVLEEPANALAPHSVALGLTRAYAPSWRVPDALRELYQNWKDAILETHQISLLEFAPSVSTTPDEITITVEKASAPAANGDAEPPKLLGYIYFNRHRGSAEFTNFGSSLDYSCLEMGHTTKKMDDRLAGGHGEGLKIAALVLCRESHQVRIAANGCYWHFGFNGRSKANFFCRLTPVKARQGPGTTNKQRAPPRLSARIWEDVSITIRGLPLQEADFEAWRRDTIDLGPIDAWIRTSSGDLLLAPCYRDRLYLKGIHIPETGFDRSAFHFGYNLISGSVGRDRQRLLNASQVTDRIHAIWEKAITQDEAKILPRYLELLQTHPSAADACDADRVVTATVAKKLWAALRSEATAANQFYCPKSRCNQDDPIIQSELRKRPTALPDLLWNILRKYDLVREPLEELHSRFRHSQEVDLPDTTFSQGVARTLRALLMLHPSTAGVRVVFVRCDAHTVDLAYQAEEDILYVHKKWLHTPAPDPPALPPSIERTTTVDVFACQHVVEELYRRALTMVFGQPDGMRSGPSIWQLLQIAQQKLRQMACIVQVLRTDVARTLQVSFYTGHSLAYVDFHGAQSRYLVVLHAAGCLSAKDNLVYSGRDDVCDCPRQSVSLLSRTVVFGDLGPGPWIPAVAKMCDSSSPLEEQPAHPSMKAQDGALIVTGEDGSAAPGCEITVTDPMGEVDPVAVVVVAPALSPPPAQVEINDDAGEEDDTLSEVETIVVSDTDFFLEEIAQDITVAKSNRDEVPNHGAD
ncbi:hypothetical protein BJX68DRAFT_276168 [Aspergillus pseudodeflectus]|uniref:Uncharacterized protein n=1 Tax=Aspergillus pseudodeflectus TaxID=176178 RepID=A0ABR4KCG4_9EURO